MATSNKYRGMNKASRIADLGATLSETMKLPTEVRRNALLNSDAASDLASTGEGHAGATMNVNTYHLASEGEPLHFVGGEKDSNGNGIPTQFEGRGVNKPFISPLSILQHASRIREATGGRHNASVGLWLDPKQKRQGVQVDASAGYGSKDEAVAAMADRPQEKAGWSMADMSPIDNPAYNRRLDPKSKMYGRPEPKRKRK